MLLIRRAIPKFLSCHAFPEFGLFACLIAFLLAVNSTVLSAQDEDVFEISDPSMVIEYPEGVEGEVVIEDGSQFSDVIDGNFIQLAPDYSRAMLDFQNRQSNKEILLLEHSLNSSGQTNMTLGAQLRASAIYGKTNDAGKFPYLGRFPTDFEGNYASDFRMLQANLATSVSFGPRVHGYVETLFSDVFSFDNPKQGSYQVRQAYVVFGDFSRSSWYGYLGKKNVGFGDMGTLSPFSQSIPWHYFGALGEGGGIGFDNGIVSATFAGLSGGRGVRVVDSKASGDVNNFAANLLLRMPFARRDGELKLGGGYLYGTIYDADVPEHLDPTLFGDPNGAWDVNARMRINRLHLGVEYVRTVSAWPVTDHDVIAYSAEAALDSYFISMPARWSLSWSEGIQGPPGTEFEFNRQLVLGYRVEPSRNSLISLEYVRSTGFAPLIGLTSMSDRDVVQNSIVLGLTFTL
ncbi:MAG: hypothetical protein GY748_04345 [Planctomycetaceae bacterium]|nr:hypothetical protein [Planctomycetaceae bacterium]